MFDRAPREREAVSWGYALFWAVLIFVTVPYVRVGVNFVREYWGLGFFTYAVDIVQGGLKAALGENKAIAPRKIPMHCNA